MKSRYAAKLVGIAVTALTAIALIAPIAQAETPAPGYSQFAGCPSLKENAKMSACLRSVVNSGNFKMGNKNVTIENPITISGGADENLQNFAATSKGGMPPVKEKVPGGLVGLTGLTWLAEFLGIEALTVYAATELAGVPNFGNVEEVILPIKVHLINATLGNKCYVGSASNPITLHLSTNVSPGHLPEEVFQDELEILQLKKSTYVDKTFSAPGASGCVLTLFGFIPISLNGVVNLQSGLPAPSGNETVQNTDTEIADVRLVYP
jgi:hypothetical protein